MIVQSEPMKILMLAPEPFFTVRGTPFSILHRVKALSELGHEVDLVTYHLGEDVSFPGLAVYRTPRLPFLRHVKVGPSLVKIPLDLLLFFRAGILCLRKRYDCIHTHEEAALMGAMASAVFGVVHVYDMHSSLPQQFVNYNYFKLFPGLLLSAARMVERFILAHSDAVIAICPHLKDIALAEGARGRVDVIENPPLISSPPGDAPGLARRLRDSLGIGDRLVALYTGTFEYNQGLEEIVRGIPLVVKEVPDIVFLLAGGEPHQVEALRALGDRLGISGHLILPGRRPLHEMDAYMAASDILLSFRKIGTNTPLKIYSYLWSGTPTVATDLLVHTQVLNGEVALLTEPTVEAFARGIVTLARDRALRRRIGENGRRLAERRYSPAVYLAQMRELCAAVQAMARRGIAVFLMSALICDLLAERLSACGELASFI
jgi:glycosyltransferase involved in cell wall biosynthesis